MLKYITFHDMPASKMSAIGAKKINCIILLCPFSQKPSMSWIYRVSLIVNSDQYDKSSVPDFKVSPAH